MKQRVILTTIAVTCIGAAAWASYQYDILWLQILIGIILAPIALLILLTFIALASVLFKNSLSHDPAEPRVYQIFLEVKRNRSAIIHQGGRPLYVVRGDEGVVEYHKFWPWNLYQRYVMWSLGRHVFLPYFTEPTVYNLAKRKVDTREGHTVLEDKPSKSNHVRTSPEPWAYKASGVYVSTVPMTVKLVVTYSIRRGPVQTKESTSDDEVWEAINKDAGKLKMQDAIAQRDTRILQWEMEALYKAQNWSNILDQAVNGVTRKIMASKDVTLDMIIDQIYEHLWEKAGAGNGRKKKKSAEESAYAAVSRRIKDGLKGWTSGDDSDADEEPFTLGSIGIKIHKVDVLAFEPELSEKDEAKLSEAAFALQRARGTALEGKGQAEAQKALIEVVGDENTAAMIQAQALQQAAEGSDILTALLTAFTQNVVSSNTKGGS